MRSLFMHFGCNVGVGGTAMSNRAEFEEWADTYIVSAADSPKVEII